VTSPCKLSQEDEGMDIPFLVLNWIMWVSYTTYVDAILSVQNDRIVPCACIK
jgi:hypothetical protein